ncbi:GLE1-domain-containing protein [Lindgomyces ingoldianus]|uniref:GLE1-domain-containing protein n=1 Tax=Lindgomyces ingoldianus TaxID=673940 RepID=A0ACB6QZ47_9PLEO|nr:GLE1-domain-containing protein [Lindgomyces ingoldianus]KAF2472052.1 GLE1-domain-containing protein [Lindgomyces ingoldianus]
MAVFLELSQMLVTSDRDSKNRLDIATATHAGDHHEQLAKAAQEHDRIREGAERELERLTLESLQLEKAIQEAELQQLRQAEQRRREIAQLQLDNAQEQQFEIERVQLENVKREIQLENIRREAEAKQRAIEQKKIEHALPQPTPAPPLVQPQHQVANVPSNRPELQPSQSHLPSKPAVTNTSAGTDIEELHTKYLQLHERMKRFRKAFPKEYPAKHPMRDLIGNTRRDMRLRMGQITTERNASKAAIGRMREILNKAQSSNGPTVDIRPYIVSQPLPAISNEAEAQYPAVLLYAWICFEKSLIKQFEQEAANEDGRIIQELGLIAASLICDPKYTWKGLCMKDILLAKYHKAAPMLFGITGRMDTREGQARLGWVTISGNDPETNVYNQRMIGLGAGYAALSLRSFSGKLPAFPISDYWRAISSICNTPVETLYDGHFMLLKGLMRDYASKFLHFYGNQAKGVLRRAAIDLPNQAPARAKDAANLVKVLPDVWKTHRISLE